MQNFNLFSVFDIKIAHLFRTFFPAKNFQTDRSIDPNTSPTRSFSSPRIPFFPPLR